jgi:hypothetical protein
MKRGRRQEPHTIAELSASGLPARWIRRVPAAVLLRFAIRKRKQQNPSWVPAGIIPPFLSFVYTDCRRLCRKSPFVNLLLPNGFGTQ